MIQPEEMDFAFGRAYNNLSVPSLVEVIIKRKEGILSSTGALSVKTGKFTGRSPDDRYIVDDEETHTTIDWGKVNHPISEDNFEKIFRMMKKHMEDKEIYIFDGFVGADPENRLPIRIVNNRAWHNLLAGSYSSGPTQKNCRFMYPNSLCSHATTLPLSRRKWAQELKPLSLSTSRKS
jgi:phosphoenolpyruvate carboxykinase (ATP)